MKKIILRVLAVLFLLALAAPVVLAMWLQSYISPEYLVKATEERLNCRAHLDSSSLTLFSWPPSLRLSGIKLAPRDEHVGKPLAERPPLGEVPVRVDMAYAELLSNDILQRRITPNLIRFVGIEIHETLDPQTGSTLEKLFLPPMPKDDLAIASEVPRAIPVEEATPTPQPGAPRTYEMTPASQSSEPIPAPAPPRPTRIPLKEIRLEQARIHIKNNAVASQIDADIHDLDLHLTEIDVDPDDLANHNRIRATLKTKITVKGMAEVAGRMQPVQFANVSIRGEGMVVPLEPTQLLWKPEATLGIVFERGSTIGGHMTLGDAAGDKLNQLKENGIDLSGVRIGGELVEDATASIFYDREALFFKTPARIALPDFEFTVKQDAWINSARDAQFMPVRIVFGPAIREPLIRGISDKGLGEFLTRSLISLISDERGNPFIDLVLTGSLSKPDVQLEVLGKVQKLLKGSGIKDLLKDEKVGNLLEGLFKKL